MKQTSISKLFTKSCVSISLAALMATPAMADDWVQFGAGVDYSTGSYGNADDTEITAVPVSVKYNTGDFQISASIPYLSIKGPGTVVGGGDGGAIPGGTPGPVTRQSGIGDVTLKAAYFIPLAQSTYFEVTGRAKLPTASKNKNLGTGETDLTAEASLTQQFGSFSLSAKGGRRFNGRSDRFPLRDVWLAGASAYYVAGDTTFGLDYDWRQASIIGAGAKSEVTGSVTHKLSDTVRLQAYGYTGFTNGSPDAGGGLQLLFRLGA